MNMVKKTTPSSNNPFRGLRPPFSTMKKLKINWNNESYESFYITNTEDTAKAVTYLKKHPSKLYGLDIETGKRGDFKNHPKAGLCPHLSFIRLIQVFDPLSKRIFIFDARMARTGKGKLPDVLRRFLENSKFIAHNAIFEIKHFLKEGIEVDCICSMILAMFIENAEHSPFEPKDEEQEERYRPTKGFGLRPLIQKYFALNIPKEAQLSDWNKKELSNEQLAYAALDAVLTYKLGKHLYSKLEMYKMKRAFKVYKDMQYVIADMELNGMGFDIKAHNDLIDTWESKKTAAARDCFDYFGDINIRSSKQLHEWVENNIDENLQKKWPRSDKTQKFSFNKTMIKPLVKECDALVPFIEYKKYATLLSTFGESLQKQINPQTSRVHCSFSLGHTRTGRLSSREPNLQNMPARDDSFRHVFVADPGNVLVVADFNQIEIRVAGELSKDPEIRGAYKRGEDLHSAIVADLENKEIEDVTKDERQLGKAINFGLQFGMGAKKLAFYAETSYGVSLSESESQRAYDAYHNKYAKYTSWSELQRRKAQATGWTRTPLGKMRKLEIGEEYTKAVNTPVQGGAAEVSYLALISLRKRLKDNSKGIKILNTVHDEIIVECPEGLADYVWQHLVDAMKEGMTSLFPKAPGLQRLVGGGRGPSWSEAK